MMISPVTQELQRAQVDHIVPLQIASSILLYGFCQRMYEIIKPDGQKCCMWMMAIFSERGPLRHTAFPNRYINQRSFPRSHLEMNTVQPFLRSSILLLHEVSQPMNTKGKTHSTHSGCLSSNYHRRLSPEERILHQHSKMIWFSSCFFSHECAQMFIFMRFGAAGYSRFLKAESRTRPRLQPMMYSIQWQRRRKRGMWQVVNRCRKLQEQLLLHAPSIWAILKQQNQRVQYGCCSLLCAMRNYDASVNGLRCKQKQSSQLDGVDLYMGAPQCWALSSHSMKVQRSFLGQVLLYGLSIHVLPVSAWCPPSHIHIRLIKRLHVWVY